MERIQEYSNIVQEEEKSIESDLSANWPTHGSIKVENLSVRYADDLPNILHNITFRVNDKEKIAIVGRTGSGKTSLSLAFFRILPFTSGSITIDGRDISTISLYDLRSKLTIIPQDACLFTGTIRSNLDPLELYDDEKIWTALNRVQLIESLQETLSSASEDGTVSETIHHFSLDSIVSENGSNFSQGQRQLICLARSILQSSKILILDEATANVDNVTDSCIQRTIRQEFVDQTIITIAHRLRTIIDYDKVLVLDNGKIVEFGTPFELISNESGIFRSMCVETGEYEELLTLSQIIV